VRLQHVYSIRLVWRSLSYLVWKHALPTDCRRRGV